MAGPIVAIDLHRRLALTEDGLQVEITNLFDSDGDDTDDPAQAVAFVAMVAEDDWRTDLVRSYGLTRSEMH